MRGAHEGKTLLTKSASPGMMHAVVTQLVDKAVRLHQAHMDGTEPTSDASQRTLMRYLEGAQRALKGQGSGGKATREEAM